MTAPAPRPNPTLKPPPTQRLAVAYFTPLLAPLPVGTRIPQAAPGQEVIDYFLRVEPGGGTPVNDRTMFRIGVILHSYCPNNDETVGEENMQAALAWGGNAQGVTIELRNGEKWYVTDSSASAAVTKHGDPLTNLTRFRGTVTWMVPGMPLAGPARGVVGSNRAGRQGVHNVNTPDPGVRAAAGSRQPGMPDPSVRRTKRGS